MVPKLGPKGYSHSQSQASWWRVFVISPVLLVLSKSRAGSKVSDTPITAALCHHWSCVSSLSCHQALYVAMHSESWDSVHVRAWQLPQFDPSPIVPTAPSQVFPTHTCMCNLALTAGLISPDREVSVLWITENALVSDEFRFGHEVMVVCPVHMAVLTAKWWENPLFNLAHYLEIAYVRFTDNTYPLNVSENLSDCSMRCMLIWLAPLLIMSSLWISYCTLLLTVKGVLSVLHFLLWLIPSNSLLLLWVTECSL